MCADLGMDQANLCKWAETEHDTSLCARIAAAPRSLQCTSPPRLAGGGSSSSSEPARPSPRFGSGMVEGLVVRLGRGHLGAEASTQRGEASGFIHWPTVQWAT